MIIIDPRSATQASIPNTDLVIIVGKNNAGKSRLLKKWRDTFATQADYIPPNRFDITEHISADMDTELTNQRNSRKESTNPARKVSELPSPQTFLELVALKDANRNTLIEWHNKYFDVLKIEKKDPDNTHSNPVISIGNKEARLAGSGSRAVLGLLSRLFDPLITHIFIDEPEIGLEPRIQKRLFELIKKVSKGEDGIKKKKVILTTHSNLFLDKDEIGNNWKLEKVDENSSLLTQVSSEAELLSTSFDLLGASPSDLFFPSNIIIVEGRSDQIFISKILDLKYSGSKISIHFAEGINKISHALPAVEQMLKSLTYLPLYKDKICVLIDKDITPAVLPGWRAYLNDTKADRVIEVGKNGIEYFYPKTLLTQITGIAEQDLDTAVDKYLIDEKGSTNHKASLGSILEITKVELAEKVTALMTKAHLPEVDQSIVSLIEKCFLLKI